MVINNRIIRARYTASALRLAPMCVSLVVALSVIACRDKPKEQGENVSGAALTVADTVKNTPEKDSVSLSQETAYGNESEKQSKHDSAVVEAAAKNTGNDIDIYVGYKCKSSGRVEAIYARRFIYRGMKRTDIRDTSTLIGLFCGNDGCYLKPAKISFLDGWDECAGLPVLTLKSDALFLFSNFINYSETEIPSVPLGKGSNYCGYSGINGKAMPPGKRFTFEFGDTKYVLEAFGEKTGDNEWGELHVRNYSLVFSIKGTSRKDTIVTMELIDGTCVKLLFIGDLDSDGKPDIILDAPDFYETNYVILFLSSKAKKGKYLRCECINVNNFDC